MHNDAKQITRFALSALLSERLSDISTWMKEHHLQLNLPGEDWATIIGGFAASYGPFQASGLSIDWWVQTVMDRANSMG